MTLFTLFWWLLVFSALISCSLASYALSRREVPGATPFAVTMIGWFLWAFGYLLELQAPTLDSRILWDNVQFFGIDLAVAGGLLFALTYTGRIRRLRPAALQLGLFPLLNLFMVWTDDQHGLLRIDPLLQRFGGMVGLSYGYGPWFWIVIVYSYLVLALAFFLLIAFVVRARVYRPAVLAVVIGFSAPTIGGLITASGMVPIVGAERLDISPLTFAISGPIAAWGLFRRNGLFDLVPIARSLLIDQMLDGMLVIDQSGHVIDANLQAHRLLGIPDNALPGRGLADLPAPIAALATSNERRQVEVRLAHAEPLMLDVTVAPLEMQCARQPGWLIVLRDVTERAVWIDSLRTQAQYNRALAACSQMLLREIQAEACSHTVLNQALEAIRTTLDTPRLSLCEHVRGDDGSLGIVSIAENTRAALPALPFDRTAPCAVPAHVIATLDEGRLWSGSAGDFAAADPAMLAELRMLGAEALMLLPVYSEGGRWGVLMVCDDQPGRAWEAAATDFLRTTADMFASYMQHTATLATLRARERFIEQVNQTTPDLIYVYDLQQRRVVYLNQASVGQLGYTPEELRAAGDRAVINLIHPADYPQMLRHRANVLAAADREVLTIEYRVRDANGNLRWMFGRDRVFSRDSEGRPVLMLGIAQDITARKEAEIALQSSEARMRALLDALPDLMFLLNHEGVFLDYQAQRSEELLVSPKRFLGSPIEQVLPPEVARTARRAMEDLRTTGSLQIFEYAIEQAGTIATYEARLAPVADEGVLVIVRDVTEARRSTEALREAKERAESADRAKSMFVAQMSHEMRTPLNAVIGMIDLLRETPLNDEQRDLVGLISTGGQSLLAIVNDILDLARIEAGRIELAEQPFVPAECLNESLDLVRHSAEAKGLDLRSEHDPGMPEYVLGDPARLRQILVNLLANAIKFTDRGAVTLRATCRVEAPDRVGVAIAISDTGIGIAPEQNEAIFAPFAQADESISRRYGGTGLGLTISRQLATLMRGTLEVTSTPGRGSTFILRVPFQTLPAPEQAPGTTARETQPTVAASAHILIVEDNPINREVLRRMLLRLGYTCDVVVDGVAALEAVQNRRYDVVLMDIQMPGLDGVATTQGIRLLGDRIVQPAIIAVTASALSGDRERYLAAGMNAYLSKPVHLIALQEVLQEVMLP